MAGGTWTQADAQNTSTRPGLYANFIGQAQTAVQPGAQGIVAICGTADWGQLNGLTTLTTEAQIQDALGSGGQLPLLTAQALRGGAAKVLCYRMGVSGTAAKASVTLQAADASGAALVLTAKYEGARANNFTVKVSTNANNSSLKDLTILEGSTVLEIFTAASNDIHFNQISGLVVGINPSKYVTATVSGATGRALANNGSGALMTGGDSGLSVTATEYSAAMTALETQTFNLFIPGDTTNTAIQASVRAWVVRLRDEGKKFQAVMGGQSVAGFSSTAVATEFQAMIVNATSTQTGNHEGVVMCFPGIVDELTGASLSGAQSAARAAGMIAKAGFNSSVTQNVTGGSDVTARMVNSDVKLGLSSGLLLFTTQGSNVVIEQGINTLTAFTSTKGRNYRKIRIIRTLDAIAQTLRDSAQANLVGAVNNDSNGRAFANGLINQALTVFQNAGAIQPGFTIRPDVSQNASADADEYFLQVGISPIDSMEKIFLSIKTI